jgi:transcriptional regulator NrdR family protein
MPTMNFSMEVAAVNCPKCGSDNFLVADCRQRKDYISRRRWCQNCGHRFSTVEVTVEQLEEMKRKVRLFNTISKVVEKNA